MLHHTNLGQVSKMTLNTKRSNVPHMRTTTTTKSQISPHLAIQSAVFELQPILR